MNAIRWWSTETQKSAGIKQNNALFCLIKNDKNNKNSFDKKITIYSQQTAEKNRIENDKKLKLCKIFARF